MRNKLSFLIGASLKKKVKSKWFLIANIVIALLVISIINIDSIISLFGGDFDKKITIYVVDETGNMSEMIEENLSIYEKQLYGEEKELYEIKNTNDSVNDIVDLIQNEEKDAILINIYYENELLKAKLLSLSTLDTYDYQIIMSVLNSTAQEYILSSIDITEEDYNKLLQGIQVEREILDETINSEDENMEMIMTTVFPAIILPFFMLTIFLIQFIGTEINDEKSTKSMEIIVSSVSPKTHFASKIISNNIFIIGQIILMAIYSYIGLKLRTIFGGDAILNGVGAEVTEIIHTLKTGILANRFVPIIILSIVLMIFTFIAYSLLAGILASMTTNAEDYQHVQTPLVFILLIGYYLATMAGVFSGSTFIRVLSYFPLISAILSPSLLVLGQIGIADVFLSIGIMLIFIYFLIKYGIKIYKDGILNYSSVNIWKKILNSLRNS